MSPPNWRARRRAAPSRARSRIHRLAGAYALGLLSWRALRRLTRDRPWWLHLINDFAPVVFAPTPALVAGALAARSPFGLLASAIPIGMFASLYRSRWRRRPASPANGDALRLMTFNLLCRPRSAEASIASIREVSPDIVILQEATPELGGPLVSALEDEYPYQFVHLAPHARGAAVLSRVPIQAEERFQLSARGWFFQDVRFNWQGRSVALFNVHLVRPSFNLTPRWDWVPYDARDRAIEVKRLLDRVMINDHDVILAGDFNFTDQTSDYRAIRSHFRDAFLDAGRGFGFTYPANTPHASFPHERHGPPLLRLDHIFYQGLLRPRLARVGPNGDSDHFSLVTEFVRV